MELSKAIRAIRKRLGETQDEFAWVLTVARNTVSQYETGQIIPSMKVLSVLLEYAETDDEKAAVIEAIRVQLSPDLGGPDLNRLMEQLRAFRPPAPSAEQHPARTDLCELSEFAQLTARVAGGQVILDQTIIEILRLWADHGKDRRFARRFRDAAAFLRVHVEAPDAAKEERRNRSGRRKTED